MSNVPLALVCPYCTCERTYIVSSVVRAFGPGWVLVKMRCDADGCRRVWHARMALTGVYRIREGDTEITELGAEACLRAGGFACPRCLGTNVQVPTETGPTGVLGPESTIGGMCLWCVCFDCEEDHLAVYQFAEVVKRWSWHSPFRRGR
jgi:hypothetical protein